MVCGDRRAPARPRDASAARRINSLLRSDCRAGARRSAVPQSDWLRHPGCCRLGSPKQWRARGRGMPRVDWQSPKRSTGREESSRIPRPRQMLSGRGGTTGCFNRPGPILAAGVQVADVQPQSPDYSRTSPLGCTHGLSRSSASDPAPLNDNFPEANNSSSSVSGPTLSA